MNVDSGIDLAEWLRHQYVPCYHFNIKKMWAEHDKEFLKTIYDAIETYERQKTK